MIPLKELAIHVGDKLNNWVDEKNQEARFKQADEHNAIRRQVRATRWFYHLVYQHSNAGCKTEIDYWTKNGVPEDPHPNHLLKVNPTECTCEEYGKDNFTMDEVAPLYAMLRLEKTAYNKDHN